MIPNLGAKGEDEGGRFFVSRFLYNNVIAKNKKLEARIKELEYALEWGAAKPKKKVNK
jgi:hypothetical protein